MNIKDDRDIIKAIGYVTVYSAYLEDELANLSKVVRKFTKLKNIEQYRAADQARQLRKKLRKLFFIASDYSIKSSDHIQVTRILKEVEKIVEERNDIIHSVLQSMPDETVIQKNKRRNSHKLINSTDIYYLADHIFKLQSAVFGLQFPICRLHGAVQESKLEKWISKISKFLNLIINKNQKKNT